MNHIISESNSTKRNCFSSGIPVLLVARELGLGGIERDVSKFARYLGANGIVPHVACFNPGGLRWQEIEAAGIPVVSVPVTSFKSKSVIAGCKVLKNYVQEHAIQVVHAFDIPADVFSVPVAKMAGVPVTLSSQLCYRELSPPFMRMLLTVIDRLATALFVNCTAIADYLVEHWMVRRERIEVCYNGFESNEFHPNNRVRPASLSSASVVIGTVAVLREEKNLSLLLQGFQVLLQHDSRARLLIVGGGPEKVSLCRLANALGIADACVFEDATNEPAKWMRAIDVFVMTSRSEAFPNALLEAMACGCCVVSSRVGGTPELIIDGKTGFLFEPSDQARLGQLLCMLSKDSNLRLNIAHAGSSFAEQTLTIEIAASRLASIYKRLLTGRAGTSRQSVNL